MSDIPNLILTWDGEALRPAAPYMAKLADKALTVGENYRMSLVEERSIASHNHYFAAINAGWLNLRESMVRDFPSPEHLRAYALIATGYCDTQTFVASSRSEALRLAAFMQPMDAFSVVVAREATVMRHTARSQSMKAMGKKDFQESKDRVLHFIAGLIDTTAAKLVEAA